MKTQLFFFALIAFCLPSRSETPGSTTVSTAAAEVRIGECRIRSKVSSTISPQDVPAYVADACATGNEELLFSESLVESNDSVTNCRNVKCSIDLWVVEILMDSICLANYCGGCQTHGYCKFSVFDPY